MLWVEGKTFKNEDIKLDYTRWRNCNFINCKLHIKYGELDLVGCDFDSCTLIPDGPAITILKICGLFYPTLPLGKGIVLEQKWIDKALNWINKKNPEGVKTWIGKRTFNKGLFKERGIPLK